MPSGEEVYLTDFLSFDFAHSPWWRQNGTRCHTDSLLQKLHANLKRVDELNVNNNLDDRTAREKMMEDLVEKISVDEDVTAEEETAALRKSLKWLELEGREQGEERVVTVDLLVELHSQLLQWDTRRRGLLRHQSPLHEVFALTDSGRRHVYPAAELVHSSVQSFCDMCNMLSLTLAEKRRLQGTTLELLSLAVRLGAWAYKSLVSLHPFLDGNGRTTRLLLTHLLSNVFPFPVSLCLPNCEDTRAAYLRMIVDQKPVDERRDELPVNWTLRPTPSLLASFLLESLVASSEQFLDHVSSNSPSEFHRSWSGGSTGSCDSGLASSIDEDEEEDDYDVIETPSSP